MIRGLNKFRALTLFSMAFNPQLTRQINEPQKFTDTVEFAGGVVYSGSANFSDGITAGTTQTQAGGTQLTNAAFQFITVSATTGDSVVLPAAVTGTVIEIKNSGAATAKVWPAVGDTINGGAVDAADATQIGIGNSVKYIATSDVNWNSIHYDAV